MSCPCGQLADRRGNLIFLSGDGGEALSFSGWRWVRRRRGRTRADKTTGAASPAFGLRHADPAPPRRSEATTRRRGSTQSPRPSSLSPARLSSRAHRCIRVLHFNTCLLPMGGATGCQPELCVRYARQGTKRTVPHGRIYTKTLFLFCAGERHSGGPEVMADELDSALG